MTDNVTVFKGGAPSGNFPVKMVTAYVKVLRKEGYVLYHDSGDFVRKEISFKHDTKSPHYITLHFQSAASKADAIEQLRTVLSSPEELAVLDKINTLEGW
jgi:hypothetical protein